MVNSEQKVQVCDPSLRSHDIRRGRLGKLRRYCSVENSKIIRQLADATKLIVAIPLVSKMPLLFLIKYQLPFFNLKSSVHGNSLFISGGGAS